MTIKMAKWVGRVHEANTKVVSYYYRVLFFYTVNQCIQSTLLDVTLFSVPRASCFRTCER